jgi:hypothetical protein
MNQMTPQSYLPRILRRRLILPLGRHRAIVVLDAKPSRAMHEAL